MNSTTTTTGRGRIALTALALGALAVGGAAVTTSTASAAPSGVISIDGNWDPGSAHARLKLAPDADVGPVPGGLAGSDVPAIAPDGTEVRGLQSDPWSGLAHRRGDNQAMRSAGGVQAQGGSYVDITANGARLRASVPSGRVLALGYRNSTAYVGCKIPHGGYTWGWMSLYTSGGWRSGWMRSDLWEIRQGTGPGGGGTGYVPWC
ncbi:hypothetical protein [Amycolatopsis sp. cmx-4-54]|uniref:hypothetical protein n=1 Tax=Amycolatopsis sp. cmx-4-54 TaxID=2790936 RepID=UPI003979C9D5